MGRSWGAVVVQPEVWEEFQVLRKRGVIPKNLIQIHEMESTKSTSRSSGASA